MSQQAGDVACFCHADLGSGRVCQAYTHAANGVRVKVPLAAARAMEMLLDRVADRHLAVQGVLEGPSGLELMGDLLVRLARLPATLRGHWDLWRHYPEIRSELSGLPPRLTYTRQLTTGHAVEFVLIRRLHCSDPGGR